MQPVTCAIAAVLFHPEDPRAILAVRRPPDDDRLPNVWGLPAVTLMPGELPEAGLRRLGREKLNTEIEPVRMVGLKSLDGGGEELVLIEVEARLTGGSPDVAAAETKSTKYVDQQWTENLTLLAEAARRGSLCSQILLEAEGIPY